jgi:hypothetical protein
MLKTVARIMFALDRITEQELGTKVCGDPEDRDAAVPPVRLCASNGVFSWNKSAEEEGGPMMETKLSLAEIALIAGTRMVLGAGIGLLLSTRMNNDQRKAAGISLALVGGLTTIPLIMDVISKKTERAEIRAAA